MDTDFSVSPSGRAKARSSGPRIVEASLKAPKQAGPSLKVRTVVAHVVTMLGRKPQALVASVAAPVKRERLDVATAVTPNRKPNLPSAVKNMVASVDGLRTLVPNRKPGSTTNAVAELMDDDQH